MEVTLFFAGVKSFDWQNLQFYIKCNAKNSNQMLCRGVLHFLHFVPIDTRHDRRCHSIKMVTFRPARHKTAKFQQIGHTSGQI